MVLPCGAHNGTSVGDRTRSISTAGAPITYLDPHHRRDAEP